MSHETLLTLEGVDFPLCSARSCTQTLYPVTQPHLFRRTLNGVLHYVGHDTHHKYGSIIRSQDLNLIALEHMWRGYRVHVGCILLVTQSVAPKDTQVHLSRPAVPSSLHVYDQAYQPLSFEWKDAQNLTVQIDEKRNLPLFFVSYRPYLHMMVRDFIYDVDEESLRTGWRLDVEEI